MKELRERNNICKARKKNGCKLRKLWKSMLKKMRNYERDLENLE
jgi:DNA-binding IscR family transcriptional regulator